MVLHKNESFLPLRDFVHLLLAADSLGSETSNLYRAIDRDNVHGLNLTVPEDAKEVIKPWDQGEGTSKYAESGVDDQIFIHVPFAQNMRLKSVLLKLGRGDAAPQHLRIYANHPNIVDFTEAESTKPELDISPLEGEARVIEYPLRVAAFASINSLSLFFSDSPSSLTRIYYIGFKGDVRELKKEGNASMDVPAANAADAALFDRLQEKGGTQQTTAR
ncbi:DUF1000-domain-containing protein [Dendrothele bispora CBS 962.96]|uniref:DUF1000-domain-containing protein n=1 Tax=Dendrothele bispora (strain CBS 962.96) TaxID=1314807 RepID=A0A4V4HBY8_DENBC|nr:DUF1000-domain-containing protein [Dendrothele bispora CBS 962.96]